MTCSESRTVLPQASSAHPSAVTSKYQKAELRPRSWPRVQGQQRVVTGHCISRPSPGRTDLGRRPTGKCCLPVWRGHDASGSYLLLDQNSGREQTMGSQKGWLNKTPPGCSWIPATGKLSRSVQRNLWAHKSQKWKMGKTTGGLVNAGLFSTGTFPLCWQF